MRGPRGTAKTGLVSQRVARRDEIPRDPEFFCQFRREGFHAKGLGRIMAAGVEVEPVLLRIIEPLLAQFAGHQGVDPGGGEFAHGAVPAAAAERDGPGRSGTELDGADPRVPRRQLPPEFAPPQRAGRNAPDRLALVLEKPPAGPEAKLAGEQRVVADFPVGVEREMAGIERAVAAQQDGQFLVDGTGDRLGR